MRVTLVAAAALLLLVGGCEKHDRPSAPAAVEMGVQLASIDGRVRVKRAQTVEWTDATVAITLGRGDLISTDGAVPLNA